jgi:DNA-binding CsgD family transcriptional regulator
VLPLSHKRRNFPFVGIPRILARPPAGARVTRINSRLLLISVPVSPAFESPEASTLTKAECAVVELALGGLSNADIARRRRSSPRTIASQLAAAYRKLGVGSRRELVAKLAK